MYDLIALIALMAWPAVPLFLIPLHYFIRFWRKIGAWYYAVFFLIWAPVAVIIYFYRTLLLSPAFDFGAASYIGAALMAFGMLLHAWASRIIGLAATAGWSELFPEEGKFMIAGPYKYSRHPIYLAHTLMLSGVFLMTGVLSTGIITIIDFILSYFMITRIEEKELMKRFGNVYADYTKKVPRFFPL